PPSDNGYRFTDVNGDGLPDIVLGNISGGSTTYEAWIDNGHGWTRDDSWDVPVLLTTNGTTDNGYRVVDVNGDGLPDIVFSQGPSTYTSYINNGHGWTLDHSWDLPVLLRDSFNNEYGYQIMDVNGDHMADIVYGPYSQSFETYINTGHGWSSDTASWHLPFFISTGGTP